MIEAKFVEGANSFESKSVDKNGLAWVYWLLNALCIYNLQG